METIFQILAMVGVSVLGSLLYTMLKSKKYFKPQLFNTKTFFRENKFTWLYSILICSLIAVIINVVPNSADAIQSASGLAVAEEIASFLTLGFATCASMKNNKNLEKRKN